MAISARRLQRVQQGRDPLGWLAGPPIPPTSIPSMTTGYRVSGAQILGPDGQLFIARGVNVGCGPMSMGNGGPDFSVNADYVADFKARGGNTIRLVCYGSSRFPWAAYNQGYNGKTGAQAAFEYAQSRIDFWRARGVVVLVECHDITTSKYAKEHVEQVEAFWLLMANAYKTDTGVWFNPYNEPNVFVPAIDAPFSGNIDRVRERWTALHGRTCKIIRDAGAPNIIVCDSFAYANDGGKQGDGYSPAPRGYDPGAAPLLSSTYRGIVLGWHNYSGANTAAKITAYVAAVHGAGIPLLVGEFGYPVRRAAVGSSWDGIAYDFWPTLRECFDRTLETVPTLGVGLLYWSSNFADGFSLYKPFWKDVYYEGSRSLINEFAQTLPEGRSLSGQGVKFFQYLATGQAVPYSVSHSGGNTADE